MTTGPTNVYVYFGAPLQNAGLVDVQTGILDFNNLALVNYAGGTMTNRSGSTLAY